MKANQKFLKNDDDAVSPVIAVILMVAITVVLAATVYVWVSGFGASSGSPAKTMSLSSDGTLSSSGGKTYTIASATSGMRWSDLSVTVNGAAVNQTHATTNGVSACPTSPEAATVFLVCSGASTKLSTGIVSAGDSFRLTGLSSGQTLRILDAQANSVILTLTVG
jgi:flagellin-like protein